MNPLTPTPEFLLTIKLTAHWNPLQKKVVFIQKHTGESFKFIWGISHQCPSCGAVFGGEELG